MESLFIAAVFFHVTVEVRLGRRFSDGMMHLLFDLAGANIKRASKDWRLCGQQKG